MNRERGIHEGGVNLNAIIYIRRSKESTERTVSLMDQEARCREYASHLGATVVRVLVDDGVSGGDERRFPRLEKAILESQATVLIVYKQDRLARDNAELLWHLKQWGKRGINTYDATRDALLYGGNNHAEQIITTMIGQADQIYLWGCQDRNIATQYRLKSQGRRHCNHAPRGFTWKRGQIVKDDREQQLLAAHRILMGQGLSVRGRAAKLLEMGFFSRSGGPLPPSAIYRMTQREGVQ
jgi:DNA invertase Pin-like site-specific DNA recombinase